MIQRTDLLREVSLFDGIQTKNLDGLLSCLNALDRRYKKSEVVLHHGSSIDHVGVVLEGSVQVIKDDVFGNRSIISTVGRGELFAEVFAFSVTDSSPISVVATEDCTIMWIQFRRIISVCSSACEFHTAMIGNMLKLIAEKNLVLNQKIDYLSKRNIRDKLLAYFSDRADAEQSLTFTIPYNRGELADYLCVDRSALSRELGKLKKEGVLEYKKNKFTLSRKI